MSDEELDREWTPSRRPQSTMAKSFSLALDDLFKIDNSLADLDAAVSQKKQKVSSQTSELEALEARLKATEERLKAASTSRSGRSSPHQRTPLGETFAQAPSKPPASPLANAHSRPNTAGRPKTGEGRPPSSWRNAGARGGDVPPLPGQLPPSPGTSEGDSDAGYVLVELGSADPAKDGDGPMSKA